MYRAAIAAALLAAAFLAGWIANGWRLGQKHEAEQAEIQRAHAAALEALRQEDNRRIHSLTETLNAASAQLDRALADRDSARVAADSLQQRAQGLAASCTAASPAARPSQGASAPGRVLADMLRRVDEAAGGIAAFADRAVIAARSCEHLYDAAGK